MASRFEISKWEVCEAFRQVRENQGAATVAQDLRKAVMEHGINKSDLQDIQAASPIHAGKL